MAIRRPIARQVAARNFDWLADICCDNRHVERRKHRWIDVCEPINAAECVHVLYKP